MLQTSAQLAKRIDHMISRVKHMVYPATSEVNVESLDVHGEPILFEHAVSRGGWKPMAVGDEWGSAWDTTWLCFTGHIPQDWAQKSVHLRVRLEASGFGEGFTAEGLVFSAAGTPERAINVARDEVPLVEECVGGEPFEIYIEAAANPPVQWLGRPDNPNLDAQPYGKPLFTLRRAELAVFDANARQLWIALQLLNEIATALPADEPRRARLAGMFEQVCNVIDKFRHDNARAVATAWAAVEPHLAATGGTATHHVVGVGHAHIDSAWLWPLRETIRKCARTFSTVLAYLADDPTARFSCSQAVQYAWMKKHYPTIFTGIKAAIKRGQWEPIGSMWVEPDGNMTSGESLVRQILLGRGFFENELGVSSTDVWIPDVFGYAATMPGIFTGCGIDRFVTQKLSWNEFNKMPHHTFWWEGLDGSRVLTHFPPVDTYNAMVSGDQIRDSAGRFSDSDWASVSLMPFGYGDGGGGPTKEMYERAIMARNQPAMPSMEVGTVAGFFDRAEAEAAQAGDRVATWTGELYFEKHRGTFTTQAATKAGNRRNGHRLREAEFMFAAARLLGIDVSIPAQPAPPLAVYEVTEPTGRLWWADELQRAWELYLLNQFHDILPGSSIRWVGVDNQADHRTIAALCSRLTTAATTAIARQIGADATSSIVWNTLSHHRSEVIEMVGGLYPVHVPSCGYVAISNNDTRVIVAAVSMTTSDRSVTFANDEISCTFDLGSGRIVSLVELKSAYEAVAPGSEFNELQLFADYPNEYDAWDIDAPALANQLPINGSVEVGEPEGDELRRSITVETQFGSSTVSQTFVLRAGARRLDVETTVEWHENKRLLKVAFSVNARSLHATYEIAYGHVTRPTHRNTSWDQAQFEVCAHNWAHLGDATGGLAVINESKYGHDAKSNVLRLTLLRSTGSPDPLADRGQHSFTYGLMPVSGDPFAAGIVAQGADANSPLIVSGRASAAGVLPSTFSFLTIDNPHVVLEAFKPAHDGDGVILRVREARGGAAKATVDFGVAVRSAQRTDHTERPVDQIVPLTNSSLSIELSSFEVATFRLR